jgi:hypothetical protein
MSYIRHPSPTLQDLFVSRQWQGANPMDARYVFLGLDANFSIDVVRQIPEIVYYLLNGPDFWRRTGRHHPFLLDDYSGCGGRYHKNFKLIGFLPMEASQVSFVELIEKPTTGTNKLTMEDLCPIHMDLLRRVLDKGAAKYVFMPPAVIRLLKKRQEFRWLCGPPLRADGDLKVLREDIERGQIIYGMYHFSVYGKYDAKLKRQIRQVKDIVVSERKRV